MHLEPKCTVKRLEDAEPGELIAMHIHEHYCKAIVCQKHEGEIWPDVVVLAGGSPDLQANVPYRLGARELDNEVIISFGKDYFFKFDSSDTELVFHNKSAKYAAGAITMREDKAFLYVTNALNFNSTSVIEFDISNGTLRARSSESTQVSTRKWSIVLGSSKEAGTVFFEHGRAPAVINFRNTAT